MNLLNKKSIFTSMLQDGPFAVGDLPPLAHPFSTEAKGWVRSLAGNQLLKTKYRAVRSQIFDFLGISNFDEILILLHDRKIRAKTAERSRTLLGNMFGLDTTSHDIGRYLHDYAEPFAPLYRMLLAISCGLKEKTKRRAKQCIVHFLRRVAEPGCYFQRDRAIFVDYAVDIEFALEVYFAEKWLQTG